LGDLFVDYVITPYSTHNTGGNEEKVSWLISGDRDKRQLNQ